MALGRREFERHEGPQFVGPCYAVRSQQCRKPYPRLKSTTFVALLRGLTAKSVRYEGKRRNCAKVGRYMMRVGVPTISTAVFRASAQQ